MRHEAHEVHGRRRYGHRRVYVAAALGSTLTALAALTAPAFGETPRETSRGTSSETARSLSAATPEARAFACTQGLPALAFMGPRARVLADGATAATLVRACSEAVGVRTLDVAESAPSAWASPRRSSEPLVPRTTYLHQTARARARTRRMAVGAARYDLIVIAPERATGTRSMLSSVLPQLPSQTVEGMSELLAALSSDGALFGLLTSEPAALRFALTAMEALRFDGTSRPSSRIVVQRAVDHYGVWVGRMPMAMDAVIELHARDRHRRERASQPPPPSLPSWAGSTPTLLHTAVALFDERVSRLLHQHEQDPTEQQPPTYVFDIAPLHDERPLFFELTRRDRPDTWIEGDLYEHALELLGVTLALWIAVEWLAARRQVRERRDRIVTRAATLLRVIAFGALLSWSAQAMVRVLADPQVGALTAVAGLALGALAAWRARGLGRRASRLASIGGAAVLVTLAPAAWMWTAAVARVDGLPRAQGLALAIATCSVLGAASGELLPRAAERVRGRMLVSHVCALLPSFAVVAVALLFGDFRAVGVVAAVSGLLCVALSSRAGVDLHGSAANV